MNLARRIAAIPTALLAFACGATHAPAELVWDARQTLAISQTLSLDPAPSELWGQTFTIENTGVLTGVALATNYGPGDHEDFLATVHLIDPTDGFDPMVPGGTAVVAIEPDTTAAVPDWVFLAFNLPVPVQAGQRWALLVSDPTPSGSSLLASAPDDDPYAAGEGIGFAGDLAFAARVDTAPVPEPAAASLALAAVVCGLFRRRRHGGGGGIWT